MNRSLLFAAILSMSCATASTAMNDPSVSGAMSAGAGALASKVGVDQKYVDLGLSAAKSALGSGASSTQAAQQGADKAAAQAQADGKPMSDTQKSSLATGLTDLLK
jgi:phage protein D